MQVIIDQQVDYSIHEFYAVALVLHPTLDLQTVENKVNRLYDALKILERFPYMYPLARYNKEWRRKKYRDFLCEDFHFRYKVMVDKETGEQYVQIFDAIHSLLFHD